MGAFDEKQRRLIKAWLDLACSSLDEYSRFMFGWVAFNALCYALFGERALRQRPDLIDDQGLKGLVDSVRTEGYFQVREDGRVSLRLDTPGKIRIDIRERYTEDLIFSAFADQFQEAYGQWLEVPQFSAHLDEFLESIRRPQGHYVINMLRAKDYSPDSNLRDMTSRNIVKAIKDRGNLKQLVDVLYQIRSNVFHGEKVPGELNDDSIVKAARPLLECLVKRVEGTSL